MIFARLIIYVKIIKNKLFILLTFTKLRYIFTLSKYNFLGGIFMLKNKFKIIALLTLIILTLCVPFVRADEETIEPTSDVQPISETSENENLEEGDRASIEPTSENITNSDVYLIDDTVTVDYMIDGNAFIFANKVVINSQIGGNVFVCAKEVTIEENGFIVSSLFGFAEKINVSGVVCDLYVAAEEVNVSGYIYRDMRTGSKTLNLSGIVGRDAFVDAEKISFVSPNEDASATSGAMIGNNFNYTSKEEITVPENIVKGKTNFTKAIDTDKTESISDYILDLGTFVCTVAVLWLLALWLTPKFIKEPYNILSKKVLPALGYGILAPIVFVFAFVVLLILGITVNIALLAFALLIMLIAISSSAFVITANSLVCSKLKIEKTIQTFGILIISAVVYWLITLIPVVGSIISLLACIIGLGIIVYNILPLKKSKTDKVEIVEVESDKTK